MYTHARGLWGIITLLATHILEMEVYVHPRARPVGYHYSASNPYSGEGSACKPTHQVCGVTLRC
jgi:hypothetical protein